MNDFKNVLLIILTVVIFALLYLIFIGSFCHCSPVKCPNNPNSMRYFA